MNGRREPWGRCALCLTVYVCAAGAVAAAPSAVEEIVRAGCRDGANALVVVDEAYFHYAGQTFFPRLGQYPNLVILRTLSKVGLAGIRLGILVADAAVVEEIDRLVDMKQLEDTLMAEGIAKFANPQKALLALVAKKRQAVA